MARLERRLSRRGRGVGSEVGLCHGCVPSVGHAAAPSSLARPLLARPSRPGANSERGSRPSEVRERRRLSARRGFRRDGAQLRSAPGHADVTSDERTSIRTSEEGPYFLRPGADVSARRVARPSVCDLGTRCPGPSSIGPSLGKEWRSRRSRHPRRLSWRRRATGSLVAGEIADAGCQIAVDACGRPAKTSPGSGSHGTTRPTIRPLPSHRLLSESRSRRGQIRSSVQR